MLVRDAIDAQGNLVRHLPWISNLQIKSIHRLSPSWFCITLANGKTINAQGDAELENLKAPSSNLSDYRGPRHETAEDYKSRQGWGKMTPEDYRSQNAQKRNRVL